MKKTSFMWSMLTMMMVGLLSVSFTSCDGDDEPEPVPEPDAVQVNNPSILFGESGGTQSITVTSNTSWTASGGTEWFSFGPAAGSGNGSINVTVQPNTNQTQRTATIYINAGKASATITVTQTARPLDLADKVAGTYSGRLTLGGEVLEDAYIIKVMKQTATTVTVDAPFFGGEMLNFNLMEEGNQIIFSNATIANFSMVVMGNQMSVNYLSNGGNMLTYTGTK